MRKRLQTVKESVRRHIIISLMAALVLGGIAGHVLTNKGIMEMPPNGVYVAWNSHLTKLGYSEETKQILTVAELLDDKGVTVPSDHVIYVQQGYWHHLPSKPGEPKMFDLVYHNGIHQGDNYLVLVSVGKEDTVEKQAKAAIGHNQPTTFTERMELTKVATEHLATLLKQ